jgi:hypothetical protein
MPRQKTTHMKTTQREADHREATCEEANRGEAASGEEHAARSPHESGAPIRARLQLALAFTLLGVLIVAGAFLPARIADSFDSLLLEKVETQTLVSDYEIPPIATPLIDRLKLFETSDSDLMILPLQTGGHLDKETIGKTLDRELEDLRIRGLYPTEEMIEGASSAQTWYTADANLYIRPARLDVNGIIWTIALEGESFAAKFTLDDESEKVLGYSITYKGPAEDMFTEQSGKRWMDYLGLSAGNLRVTEKADAASWAEGNPLPVTPPVTPPVTFPVTPSVSENSAAAIEDSAVTENSVAPKEADAEIDSADCTIPQKHLIFTLETKTSPLKFHCVQSCYEGETYFSLQFAPSN